MKFDTGRDSGRHGKDASKTRAQILPLGMRSLQVLLTILDGQKLSAGYLTPKPTALETMIDLKRQADGFVLNSLPTLPPATLLFTPAWVASLKGRDAIFLAGVDGNLDLSKSGPAYVFAS
jgi:hypothetical protein